MKKEESAEEKYADILHESRPEDPEVFRKHPRMSTADRAKIFSPFSALRGHSERLSEEDEKSLLQTRPELSEEKIADLNAKLTELCRGDAVLVSYFLPESPGSERGCYTHLQGKVTAIDPVFHTLRIDDTVIAFEDLSDIIKSSD